MSALITIALIQRVKLGGPNRHGRCFFTGELERSEPPFTMEAWCFIVLSLENNDGWRQVYRSGLEDIHHMPPPRDAGLRQACSSTAARSTVYTANMATPAKNIAPVVIATTIHPTRELGWPCISVLSDATIRIATRRKGANNPLMTAVQ
jgi:hypothetical protein